MQARESSPVRDHVLPLSYTTNPNYLLTLILLLIYTITGDKPYICDVCNTGFARLDTLETHRRTHTGERPYVCETCTKTFTSSSHLAKHKRLHPGAKPYACDVCNMGFARMDNLKSHKRTHMAERPHIGKPYNCDVCHAGFAQLGGLETHMRSHTGERPYECVICTQTFTSSSHLAKHKRIHLVVLYRWQCWSVCWSSTSLSATFCPPVHTAWTTSPLSSGRPPPCSWQLFIHWWKSSKSYPAPRIRCCPPSSQWSEVCVVYWERRREVLTSSEMFCCVCSMKPSATCLTAMSFVLRPS